MSDKKTHNLGIVFRPEHAPQELPAFARRAEAAGFDELWVWEDCFYAGGISSAAVALACTERISVGVGIMPAVVRSPVFLAMEIANLAQLYPGRFLPGLGHGVARWMRQIGAFPKSQLMALKEVTVTVREMLAGKRLTYDGKQIQLDDVQLIHPPDLAPPISLGVRGPKSLAISGEVADGTILAEFGAPNYVAWAREQIKKGQSTAGHDRNHRVTVFVQTCAAATTAAARQEMRPRIAAAIFAGKIDLQLAPLGIMPQVEQLRAGGEGEQFAEALPDGWIDQLSIAGTAEDWTQAVDCYVAAGADSIVLTPLPDKGLNELDRFADHILG